MKVVFGTKNLSDSLAFLRMCAAPGKNPVLAHHAYVRVTSAGGETVLETQSAELQASWRASQSEATEAGDCLVPIEPLLRAVSFAQESTVSLHSDGDEVAVISGSSDISVLGMDASGFHAMQKPPPPEFRVIPADFGRALRRVVPARGEPGGRFVGQGVFIHVRGGKACLAAADNRRLHVDQVPATNTPGETSGSVVTKRFADAASRMCDFSDEPLSAGRNGSWFHASSGDYAVGGLVIEGKFPPYWDMVAACEKAPGIRFSADPQEVVHAIAVAKIATREESSAVRLTLRGGQMLAAGTAAEVGRSSHAIEVEDCPEEPFQLSIKPGYLTDAVKAAGGDRVEIEVGPLSTHAVAVRCDDDFLALVMPTADVSAGGVG